MSVCVAVVTSSGLWREGARRGHGARAGPPARRPSRAEQGGVRCVCDPHGADRMWPRTAVGEHGGTAAFFTIMIVR